MEIDSVTRLAGALKDLEGLIQLVACSNLIDFFERVGEVAGVGLQAKAIEVTRPHMTRLHPDNRELLEEYIEKCGPACG